MMGMIQDVWMVGVVVWYRTAQHGVVGEEWADKVREKLEKGGCHA